MLFNVYAQKDSTKSVDLFISDVAEIYLDYSLKYSNEKKVKDAIRGMFSSLKYTFNGFDVAKLSYKDKLKLINVLYDYHISQNGALETRGTLEELCLKAKEKLGMSSAGFEKCLDGLPDGVFEILRLKNLSRKDLEEKAKKFHDELEEVRSISNVSITEHTLGLIAERDVLESILYNTNDGIFSLDRTGKIITFNKAMEELTGFSFREVDGQPAEEYIRLFETSFPLDPQLYTSMPGAEKGSSRFVKDKLTLVRRNGSKRFVTLLSTTLSEGQDVNIGCVATIIDITQEHEFERMKLDFVSIAAHELRTPITSIRGYLSLLSDELRGQLSQKHKDYMHRLIFSTDRLYFLVENLLNVSRIEKGTLNLNIQKHAWVPIVKLAVDEHRQHADSVGVSLLFEDPKENIPDVYVDVSSIVEVLSNLLDNSLRYTHGGGRVKVSLELKDDMLITHIADSGVGIPEASIPHLFKKFYRVSTTALRAGEKGTGLGLFISKSILEMHGGKIWVKSKLNEGSTFSFSLPTKPPMKGNNYE